MTTILAAMQDSVLLAESSKSGWKTSECLKGTHPQCISYGCKDTKRVYCGTFGDGLWQTDDLGQIWHRIGMYEILSAKVTSVLVSQLETIFVGTEPSALYRSDNGGESWQQMSALNNLKSSAIWSFPPRPWTSHIRWIELDATSTDHLYVAIEAGALVQSHDGGITWIDKSNEGPFDTHTMFTHKVAPGYLYCAAGDGYYESTDYGQSWKRPAAGPEDQYSYGLAIDVNDTRTIIISTSKTPRHAHSLEDANSSIYRRYSGKWEELSNGLPTSNGTLISVLTSNPNITGEFYAINNRGIFCSDNSGVSWESVDIRWPKRYLSQHPRALTIIEGKG